MYIHIVMTNKTNYYLTTKQIVTFIKKIINFVRIILLITLI